MSKTKWSEELAGKMVDLAADGMIDEEICRTVGIGKSAYYDYQTKYPQFAEALKAAKSRADDRVEAALFRRAMGYEVTETEGEPILGPQGEQLGVRITKVKRIHIEPNVTAQIFWLKNRRPATWRDQHHLHQTFDPTNGSEGVSPEEEMEVAEAIEHILGDGDGRGNGGHAHEE